MQCLSSFLGLPGLNMFPNVQIVVVGNNFYLVCCHCSCSFKKQSRAPATQWQVVKDFGTVSRAQPSTVLLVPQTADLPCLPFQYLGWVFFLACGEAPSKNNCTPFHGRGSLYQGDSAGQPCTPVRRQAASSLGCAGFGVGLGPPEQGWCQRTAYP